MSDNLTWDECLELIVLVKAELGTTTTPKREAELLPLLAKLRGILTTAKHQEAMQ